MNYYKIAVPKPLPHPLTYCSPMEIEAGSFVEAPSSLEKSQVLFFPKLKKNLTLNLKRLQKYLMTLLLWTLSGWSG